MNRFSPLCVRFPTVSLRISRLNVESIFARNNGGNPAERGARARGEVHFHSFMLSGTDFCMRVSLRPAADTRSSVPLHQTQRPWQQSNGQGDES
jgi:hypothetical protein